MPLAGWSTSSRSERYGAVRLIAFGLFSLPRVSWTIRPRSTVYRPSASETTPPPSYPSPPNARHSSSMRMLSLRL